MKKLTSRNTKTEILKAYNDLAKELKAAKAQAKAASASAASAAAPAIPDDDGDGEVSIGDIISRLGALTARIGDASSALQSRLTGEATVLQELRDQADVLIGELSSLHGIEYHEGALDELLDKYGKTAEAAEETLSGKKQAFEDEMSEQRAAWDAEQEARERQLKEAASLQKKSRQRDQQEYKYDLELTRKREDDEYDQAGIAFDRELAELREGKAQAWTEREAALAEREGEYAELKAKAEGFDSEMQDAVKRAEVQGANIARQQTKAKADLQGKDHQSARKVLELKIESLESTIAKHDARIESLSAQLDAARTQTTELAVKAIEGSSNASSFAAIKEIALEQAKTSGKGK